MLNDAAVGEHDRQPQNVLAHRSVADRRRARRARRGHAADRRVGAGIDREHQAGVLQVIVQLAMRQPGFDRHVQVFDRQPQTRVIRVRSIVMPPRTALTWPSSELPMPKESPARVPARRPRTMAATSVGGLGKRDGVWRRRARATTRRG